MIEETVLPPLRLQEIYKLFDQQLQLMIQLILTVGTGKSFIGYRYVELEITLEGTTPTWTVTPLLLNSTSTTYMEGESIVLTGAKTFVYLLQVNGSSGVNFRVDNSSGTSPTITIKGRGVN